MYLIFCFFHSLVCGARHVDCQVNFGEQYRGVARKTNNKHCVEVCQRPSSSKPHGVWCYTNEEHTESDYCAVRRCQDCDFGNYVTLYNKQKCYGLTLINAGGRDF